MMTRMVPSMVAPHESLLRIVTAAGRRQFPSSAATTILQSLGSDASVADFGEARLVEHAQLQSARDVELRLRGLEISSLEQRAGTPTVDVGVVAHSGLISVLDIAETAVRRKLCHGGERQGHENSGGGQNCHPGFHGPTS